MNRREYLVKSGILSAGTLLSGQALLSSSTGTNAQKELSKFTIDKVELLVDANDMYTLQDTIDFLKGIEGIPLYWMEEPFVENLGEDRKLKEWMMANGRERTYYADGERNTNWEVCSQLGCEGKMDVYLAHFSTGLGNVCTIEGATITTDDVDLGSYPIVDGKIVVSEETGFGMKLINFESA